MNITSRNEYETVRLLAAFLEVLWDLKLRKTTTGAFIDGRVSRFATKWTSRMNNERARRLKA